MKVEKLPSFIPATGVVWVADPDDESAMPVIGWVLVDGGETYAPVTPFGTSGEIETDFYASQEEAVIAASRTAQARRKAKVG